MKRGVLLLLVLAVGVGLFFAFRPSRSFANFPPVSGKSWVAFGDSLTAGYGATEGHDYPTLLSQQLGFPIQNFGTAGATTQDALTKVGEVLQAQPKVVLLCFGGNDTLRGVPHAETFRNLATVIDQLQQQGAFVVLIGIHSASVRDKYRSEFARLARAKRVLYIPNILQGILGDPGLMSDYVHPNDQGYAKIAARLEEELRPWLPALAPGGTGIG